MTRVFVGNLPIDVKERELDDLFYKYGRIKAIDLKTPSRPPAFAFVTFEDERDAEDAVRGRDGYNFDGGRLRVEIAKSDRRDRGGRDDRRAGSKPGGRRTDYGVVITGLPRGCSWQDLKDFMRDRIGDVVYADVDHRGEGVVEFANRDDMEDAVYKLDDTEFRSGRDSSYIRVKYANKDKEGRSDSRDRDRGGRKSRSRSRSRDRAAAGGGGDRDKSRSRSRSEDKDRDAGRRKESDDSPEKAKPEEDGEDKRAAEENDD